MLSFVFYHQRYFPRINMHSLLRLILRINVSFFEDFWKVCHVVSHWEERNKKFPLPFCVWINRPQRLTVKGRNKECKSTPQPACWRKLECRSSYLYFITSPGWIEIVVRTNRLTGWRKKKEAKWLARTLKLEAPFSSAEIGMKNAILG